MCLSACSVQDHIIYNNYHKVKLILKATFKSPTEETQIVRIKFVRHCLFCVCVCVLSEKCNICIHRHLHVIRRHKHRPYPTLNSFAYLKLNIQHFIIELMNFLELHRQTPSFEYYDKVHIYTQIVCRTCTHKCRTKLNFI